MSSQARSKKAKQAAAQVVVVGSYNQDMVWQGARFPQPGETRMGRFFSGPGGKGFNQAVAAARLAARTGFIAAVGRDPLGDNAAALARSENIDARWQLCSEATGTAAIWLDGAGQNMIIVAPGANALLSPAQVLAQRELIEQARVLLTQHEVHPVASLRAIEVARAAGVTCIHNPAPSSDSPQVRALLQAADIITPNETEFCDLLRLFEVEVNEQALAAADAAQLHTWCRMLPTATIALTLGAAGVFVSQASPAGEDPPFFRTPAAAVNVVDTTGAGDAFNGGLAASLASAPGRNLQQHVAFAVQVAGCAIESSGAAQAMPTLAEVERRFTG
ncbi:ribokinase [Pseudomarimonas arenosa]|uniref:Ribokinase n=1 Tax=Pseudomarimonas arenosa TaxID=2774145 RepID=A0AAW3ZKT5_9GAMM|nr:ribokinase [Pseudomarimonas arenosa]MBD8526129.1 ribokinase [Pseudomarimonas arenosa]